MPKRRRRTPRLKPLVQPLGIVELECPKGCTADETNSRPLSWQTKLLAFDGNGPIYVDAHCPECGQRGRRATITASDLDDNLINDQEIAEIGQERIYTFLFLITQMFNPDDARPEKQLYPVLTADFIARNTSQRVAQVEQHLTELHQMNWLDVAFVSAGKYKIAFGKPWAAWGKASSNEADQLAEQRD